MRCVAKGSPVPRRKTSSKADASVMMPSATEQQARRLASPAEPWVVVPSACQRVDTLYLSASVPTKMIADSGCRHTVAGKQWHQEFQRHLAKQSLQGERDDNDEVFRFGNGHEETSESFWVYPISLFGTTAVLRVAEVAGDCPPLLSREAMKNMDISLKLRGRYVGRQLR